MTVATHKPRHRLPRSLVPAVLALACGVLPAQGERIPDPEPEAPTEGWRIGSLAEDAGVENRTVFFLDFEPDGAVWLAASDGLYRGDGYSWRRYTSADGLPSDYVRCVRVARDGRVWVGTDRGAGTFDGKTFDHAGTRGRLPGPSVRRIVEDPDGTLWFCCDRWPDRNVSAGLARLRAGAWTTYGVADGLPSDYVSDVVLVSGNRRFVLTRKGMARFEGERLVPSLGAELLDADDRYVWSVVESPRHGVLASTNAGVFALREDGWYLVGGRPRAQLNPKLAVTRDGEVLACATGNDSVFQRWTGNGFTAATEAVPIHGSDPQVVAEAPDGAVWAAGVGFLIRWQRGGGMWTWYRDLPPPRFRDHQQGTWFADRERVLRRGPGGWEALADGAGPLTMDAVGSVWMRARAGGVARWTDGRVTTYPEAGGGLRRIEGIHTDGAGGVWLLGRGANDAAAVARFDGSRWQPARPLDPELGHLRVACSSTRSGVWVLLEERHTELLRLVHVDRDATHEVALPRDARQDIQPGLFVDRAGAVWLCGFFGLYRRDPQAGSWEAVTGLPGRAVFGLVERGDGIWVACSGTTGGFDGVACLRDGTWTAFPGTVWGFVGQEADGVMLCSTATGLLRVGRAPEAALTSLAVPGRPRILRAVPDAEGVWLETDVGVLHYRRDGIPPETVIEHAPTVVSEGTDVIVGVRGIARFEPRARHHDFGVQLQLDGGPWVDRGSLHDGVVRLAAPGLGQHTLRVRIVDQDGDVDPEPAVLRFRVQPVPLQDRPWFTPAALALFAVVVGLATLSFLAWRRLGVLARKLEQTVERRTAELQTSEHEFRALFEQSRDAILLVDPEFRVASANPHALRLLGASDEDLAGRALSDLFLDPHGDGSIGQDQLDISLRHDVEARLPGPNGAHAHVLVASQTRRTASGALAGYQVILRDVTQRKQTEERLRQSQQMEAVGRLAAGVAHDFNNILTSILGYCDSLSLDLADRPELARAVQSILEQAHRAKALTKQIQSFSRGQTTEGGVVDFSRAVADTEQLLRSVVPARIEFVWRLTPGAGHVRIDAEKLAQVLLNLTINARDAMPEGGRLTLETLQDESIRPDRPDVVLRIADTGSGMDEATRLRVFEPFFTTKPAGKGTGLGLSIVYGIVEQCGGTIHVESSPGRGTVFHIAFPSCDDRGTDDEPAALEASDGHESILVVDDEPHIRELIRHGLERHGYTVEIAADGEQALARLHAMPSTDLVVSDIVMPGMSGYDLFQRMREHDPDLRILLMSGYAAADLGPVDCPVLEKPFSTATLVRRVREVLDART